MRKDELDALLSLISKLKPNEWNQIVLYVQKKVLFQTGECTNAKSGRAEKIFC